MSILSFGNGNSAAVISALSKSQAMIEFDLDGNILTANENFCRALGYDLSEIKGKHHRMFVDPAEVASPDYAAFWAKLKRGEFDSRQYKRIGKGGKEIWIEASYNPVFAGGKPFKVVKLATDITAAKLKSAEDAGKLTALSRAQAIIEFTPAGQVITANQNFCDVLGYRLEEIVGKNHSLFVEPAYAASPDYQAFWEQLRAGKFQAAEFVRYGKGGKRAVINASYNPIFDEKGKVAKVVKFATDVTTRVENVDQLAGALKSMSEGDLTKTITTPFLPTLEKLRVDYNEASSKLRGTLQTISQNAGAIAAASQEIQSASNDLSKRTEQQAASVEETAAALEQITTAVSDSSRRAGEAGQLVSSTKADAEKSGLVVKNAITAMGAIENSSKEISNIIGVIDDIAFQTNLLALNAGVEAARAGDAGKGFAVVAQEVRELAQRSANAAKEIKALINTSSEQVKNGVSLVGQTGLALDEIVVRVADINRNVAAIVESAREQSTGLQEINTAVNQMDQGTQKNAAMVEETNAASHTLVSEVSALSGRLGQFNLGSGAAQVRPASHAPQSRTAPQPAPARPNVSARTPAPVTSHARPAASPARALGNKLAAAFSSAAPAQVSSGGNWEEF